MDNLNSPPAAQYAISISAVLCCMLFVGLGLTVIPYPGIQNDEALFASPLYAPVTWHAKIRVFHYDVPIMLMSYLGTLKTWLYIPWFRLWAPSAMSVRVPVLLIGAVTVWLFYRLLMRVGGPRVALAGVALLATDVSFLLTSSFDWGPVALQHLLLVLGVLLFVKFHQDGNDRAFAGGFLVFGLGLWDKTLFIWALVGLGVATVLLFPKEILRHLTARRAVVGTLCFLVGASPLIVYNFESRGGTIGAYTSASFKDIQSKMVVLEQTINGSVLLGYIPAEDSMDSPRSPRSKLERFSVWLRLKTGDHRSGLNALAFVLALGLSPLVWRKEARRTMLFTLIFMIVVWLQMALTDGAGGSAHHTILLWPFPVMFVATVYSEVSRRLPRWGILILGTAVLAIIGGNLLVYNQHLAQFIRDGEDGSWTDAIFPLSERLTRYRLNQIYVIDWGMLNSLRLLDRGQLLLNDTSHVLTLQHLENDDRTVLLDEISDRNHIFVGYTVPMNSSRALVNIFRNGRVSPATNAFRSNPSKTEMVVRSSRFSGSRNLWIALADHAAPSTCSSFHRKLAVWTWPMATLKRRVF